MFKQIACVYVCVCVYTWGPSWTLFGLTPGNPPANWGTGHSEILPHWSGWSKQNDVLCGGFVVVWLRTIRLEEDAQGLLTR